MYFSIGVECKAQTARGARFNRRRMKGLLVAVCKDQQAWNEIVNWRRM